MIFILKTSLYLIIKFLTMALCCFEIKTKQWWWLLCDHKITLFSHTDNINDGNYVLNYCKIFYFCMFTCLLQNHNWNASLANQLPVNKLMVNFRLNCMMGLVEKASNGHMTGKISLTLYLPINLWTRIKKILCH